MTIRMNSHPIKLLHRNPKRDNTQPGGCHVTSYICLFHLMMYLTNDEEFERYLL